MLLIVHPLMAEVCIICNNTASNFVTCCDTKSWKTLYRVAVLRDHKAILGLSFDENDFPTTPVKYHPSCDRSSHTKGTFRLKSLLRTTKMTLYQEEVQEMLVKGSQQFYQTVVFFVTRLSTNQTPKLGKRCIVYKNSRQMKR